VRILSVVGNQPQLVESASVSLARRERGIEEIAVHTSEGYDQELAAVLVGELGLAPPRYRLEAGSGTQGEQIGRMPPEMKSAGAGG
jgi:UDP-GlcNAc3NAcA epimerase